MIVRNLIYSEVNKLRCESPRQLPLMGRNRKA